MGRKFDVALGERSLRVCVSAVDEAWELWICDRRHRLALGGRIGIDEAVLAYREGSDPIAAAGRSLTDQLERGLLALPAVEPIETCPHH
jgi:hypothetical protein